MFISFAWQTPCRQASLQKLRKCVLGEGLTGYIPETSKGWAQLNRLSHWAISSLKSGRVFFGWDTHFCPFPDLQAQSKNTWVTFSPFTEACDLQEIYSCCREAGAEMTMAYWEIPFHWENADFSGDGQSWSRTLKRAQSTWMPTSLFPFFKLLFPESLGIDFQSSLCLHDDDIGRNIENSLCLPLVENCLDCELSISVIWERLFQGWISIFFQNVSPCQIHHWAWHHVDVWMINMECGNSPAPKSLCLSDK